MAVESNKKGRGYKPKGSGKPKELESAAVDSKADPIANWTDKPDSAAYEAALKLYPLVDKAYKNKEEQNDRIEEYWNVMNAQPDANQQYIGNSTGYIPAVRDALNARAKRALKQLFPANHKHVEAVASDGRTPYTQLALLEPADGEEPAVQDRDADVIGAARERNWAADSAGLSIRPGCRRLSYNPASWP